MIVISIVCLGFSIESSLKLEKHFDPLWFIPSNTYMGKFIKTRVHYYPTYGMDAALYMGQVNYTHELTNIKRMVDELQNLSNITSNVVSWVDPFRNFVFDNFNHGSNYYDLLLIPTLIGLF